MMHVVLWPVIAIGSIVLLFMLMVMRWLFVVLFPGQHVHSAQQVRDYRAENQHRGGGSWRWLWLMPLVVIPMLLGLYFVGFAPHHVVDVRTVSQEARARALGIGAEFPEFATGESFGRGDSLFHHRSPPVPPVVVHERLSIGAGVLILGVIVMGGFALMVASRRFRESVLQFAAFAFALAIVIALFVGTSSISVRESRSQIVDASSMPVVRTSDMNQSAAAPSLNVVSETKPPITLTVDEDAPGSRAESHEDAESLEPTSDDAASSSLPVVVFEGNSPDGERAEALPAWVTEQHVSLGDGSHPTGPYVVSSGQYASVSEAEQELITRIKSDVLQRLQAEYHIADPSPTSAQVLESGIIKRRAHEHLELTVGDSTYPMYRVHWEVAMQPETDLVFYEAWRGQVVNERLGRLAVLLGLLTALLGGLSVFLHVNQGRHRGKLTAGTVAALLAVGIAAALTAWQGQRAGWMIDLTDSPSLHGS